MSSPTENKKSILFVIYQLAAKGNGGVQSITNIITELSHNYNIVVLTQSVTSFNQVWLDAGAEVIVKEEKRKGLLNIISRNMYVFFLLKKIKVTTVHCNDIQSLMTSFLGVKLSFKKLIFNKRGVKPENDKYPFSWNVALSCVDHVIVLSKDMMNRVIAHFPTLKNRISYSYSIVDFNRFKPMYKTDVRKKLGVVEDKLVVGIIGRFEPLKQQLKFIKETINLLPKETKAKTIFYMIGDFDPDKNEYSKACQQEVVVNNLEEVVKLLPFQTNVEDWYNAFDYTLVVSIREGLSRSMIESLSCGTPVISFDISSAREILEEGDCGIVVHDFDEFKSLIVTISEENIGNIVFKDKALLTTRELLSLEKVVKQYSKHYK